MNAYPLPTLPLLLWDTPPGLEMALSQEGVAFRVIRDPHPLAFRPGKFVLFDGRRVAASTVRERLSTDHVAIDVDRLRSGEPIDPFRALIDDRAGMGGWEVDGFGLRERVARHSKGAIAARLLENLRRKVADAGGLWARLTAYPFPYRSAFNFRVDLDEGEPEDYAQFARARTPIEDCTTHFVSTHAYGEEPAVLADLRRFDTQSHGHYHVIARDPAANRRNLLRAHRILRTSGFEPVGFAAPHGRWNPGLDRAIEELGYAYSSDFQIGYDALPFFPWVGDRFSRVLQVPIHPVCEGLFFDAGATEGATVADYLVGVVRAKIDAGEPAFVYGHPEGRLARHPMILERLAEAVAAEPLLWRVTLTEFALWWRRRMDQRWSVVATGEGCYEVQFEDWDAGPTLGLEVVRDQHLASIPLTSPRTTLNLDDLAYVRRPSRAAIVAPRMIPARPGLRSAIRSMLDWETMTPIEEMPDDTLAARFKKGLRRWQHGRKSRLARNEASR